MRLGISAGDDLDDTCVPEPVVRGLLQDLYISKLGAVYPDASAAVQRSKYRWHTYHIDGVGKADNIGSRKVIGVVLASSSIPSQPSLSSRSRICNIQH